MRSILLINTTRFQINLISNKLIINELPPPDALLELLKTTCQLLAIDNCTLWL